MTPAKLSNIFRTGKSILIADVKSHLPTLFDEQSRKVLEVSNSTSFMAAPVLTELSKYGVIVADCINGQKELSNEDLELLKVVGQQIGVAIEKEKARQEIVEAYKKSAELAEAYSRFVPWKTLRLLNYDSILDLKLGDGVEKQMSLLFCDIRDFTTLCETMSPSETLKFLNSYLAKLSPIIRQHNGFIDKFIGDCIMAVFDNSQDAINAALEMQIALRDYNVERRIGGRRIINAGIGINTGPVVMGPIGYEDRLEMTVLSDTVNVASRLSTASKEFGAPIVVSNEVVGKVMLPSVVVARSLGISVVKGRLAPVAMHEIIDRRLKEFPVSWNTRIDVQPYCLTLSNLVEAKIKNIKVLGEVVSLIEQGAFRKAISILEAIPQSLAVDPAVSYYLKRLNDEEILTAKIKRDAA